MSTTLTAEGIARIWFELLGIARLVTSHPHPQGVAPWSAVDASNLAPVEFTNVVVPAGIWGQEAVTLESPMTKERVNTY